MFKQEDGKGVLYVSLHGSVCWISPPHRSGFFRSIRVGYVELQTKEALDSTSITMPAGDIAVLIASLAVRMAQPKVHVTESSHAGEYSFNATTITYSWWPNTGMLA